MDSDFILYLGRQSLEVALMIAAPVLLTCAVVGVVVTLFQAVTSIRDMSLTVVPKLIAVGLVLMLFGGWMLDTLLRYVTDVFGYIQNVGH
jgi:flagellar biosynthetic protein FliQ